MRLLSTLVFGLLLMFVQYNSLGGSIQHPPGTVKYDLHLDPILNDAEFPISQRYRFDLSGKLLSRQSVTASAQADIAAQIIALKKAYISGGDLILVQDNGAPSPNSIFSAKTLGGVRVIKPPEFPNGDGASYVTQLEFSVTLEAEVPFNGIAGTLWSFEESLDFDGDGGPEIGVLKPLRGPPIIQTLHQLTPVTMTQKGSATGYLGYWSQRYQPPIYPALQNHAPGATRRGKRGARAIGRGKDRAYKLWTTWWQYTFISPVNIDGTPTPWPANL